MGQLGQLCPDVGEVIKTAPLGGFSLQKRAGALGRRHRCSQPWVAVLLTPLEPMFSSSDPTGLCRCLGCNHATSVSLFPSFSEALVFHSLLVLVGSKDPRSPENFYIQTSENRTLLLIIVVLLYSQFRADGARMALTLNLRPEPPQGRSGHSGLQRFWNAGGSLEGSGGCAGPHGAGLKATTSAGPLQDSVRWR